MQKYSPHLKASQLKTIVQRDVPCLQKLNEIEKILGLPLSESSLEASGETDTGVEIGSTGVETQGEEGTTETTLGETSRLPETSTETLTETSTETSTEDKRQKSYEAILKDLSGNEYKLVKSVLQRIEVAPNVGWDYDSLELIVNDEKQLHSNIKLLILKTISVESPTIPVAFMPFVQKLIEIKLPPNFIRSPDAINLKAGLVKLLKTKPKENSNTEN